MVLSALFSVMVPSSSAGPAASLSESLSVPEIKGVFAACAGVDIRRHAAKAIPKERVKLFLRIIRPPLSTAWTPDRQPPTGRRTAPEEATWLPSLLPQMPIHRNRSRSGMHSG